MKEATDQEPLSDFILKQEERFQGIVNATNEEAFTLLKDLFIRGFSHERDLSAAERDTLQAIIQKHLIDGFVPHMEKGIKGEAFSPDDIEEAREFHIEYVAAYLGNILGLKVKEIQEFVYPAVKEVVEGTGDTQTKIAQLEKALDPEGKFPLMKEALEDEGKQWVVNFDETDMSGVAKSLAGRFATNATIEYCQFLFGQDEEGAEAVLDRILSLENEDLQRHIEENRDTHVTRLIEAEARFANDTWLKARKMQKKMENPNFMSFERMSQERGWPVVLMDIDQIRTGLRLRKEARARAKVKEAA